MSDKVHVKLKIKKVFYYESDLEVGSKYLKDVMSLSKDDLDQELMNLISWGRFDVSGSCRQELKLEDGSIEIIKDNDKGEEK